MKTLFLSAIIVASFGFNINANAANTTNQNIAFEAVAPSVENVLTYNKFEQPIIKVGASNANGMKYIVTNEKGETVLSGKITDNESILIPSFKLAEGMYHFKVNGSNIQDFKID